jgi:hypothetical protein
MIFASLYLDKEENNIVFPETFAGNGGERNK